MNILDFAIKMEKEGEAFYRKLADGNKDNGLFTVLTALAEDEKHHAEIISEFVKDERMNLPNENLPNSSGIFEKQFFNDIKQNPEQIDAYRKALQKEKESIDLYVGLMEKAESTPEKDMFGFLVEQEEAHFSSIEKLIFHLEKAESWVEAAEFGVREEY